MLFAGHEHETGPHKCYYCGADCGDAYRTEDYVKDTFTNRDIVKYPTSDYVCRGCVMSIGEGWGDMTMIDGTKKYFTTPRGMAPRMYSWLITSEKRIAFTKAHIYVIREMLTTPDKLPPPPFAVVIADSGQKQLIFRAPVAWSKEVFPVMLEDQVIEMSPEGLRERLYLAGRISSNLGKPVLKEQPNMKTYIAARKAGLKEQDLMKWAAVMHEPLSQLAAWLAPPKNKE